MTTRRLDVQALRGLAVISVLLFHASPKYFPAGYLGVDAFFVISGFVVTPLLGRVLDAPEHRGRLARLRHFYARRIRRLLPALGVMLLVTAALSLVLSPVGSSQADAAKLGLSSLALAANWGAATIAGDYFHHAPNPLIHTWSLSVEEQFYLVLPALVVGLSTIARARSDRLVAFLLGAITAASLAMTLAPLIDGPFLFYSATSRAWEFGLGGLVVLYSRKGVPDGRNAWLHAASAAGLAILLLAPLRAVAYPGLEATAAALTALVLAAGTASETQPGWRFPLQWCGDRSYSIYLWHMPLIVILRDSPVVSLTRSDWGIAAGFAGAFVMGDLSYRHIEERFREHGARDASKTAIWRIAILFIGVPLVALGLLGLGARWQFGQAWRQTLIEVPAWQLDPSCDRLNSLQPCHYIAPGAAGTALLTGDSHAGALSQAFVDAAWNQRLDADVWAMPFCPLWDASLMTATQRAAVVRALGDGCLAHSAGVLDHIRRTRPPFVVVTARSSADYGGYLGAGGSALYLAATESTLATLTGAVGRLVMVGPVPEFPEVNFGFALFQRPAFPSIARTQLPPEPFTEDIALAAVARKIGATFISGVAPYCTPITCEYQGFLDLHHVSPRGAERLRPALERALAPLR